MLNNKLSLLNLLNLEKLKVFNIYYFRLNKASNN
jgi:hypothetical protein